MPTINLGRKPSEPSALSAKEPESKEYFPSIYLSESSKEVNGLPEGEFSFSGKGKVVSRTESTTNGKTRYSCEIEIHEITPEGKAKDSDKSLDDSLTEIESKKMDDGSEEDDEE